VTIQQRTSRERPHRARSAILTTTATSTQGTPSARSRSLRGISSLSSIARIVADVVTLFQRERASPFQSTRGVDVSVSESPCLTGCPDGPPRSPPVARRGVRLRSHRARSPFRDASRGTLLGCCARVACSQREQSTPAGRSHWPLHRVTRFARAPCSTSLCSVERRAWLVVLATKARRSRPRGRSRRRERRCDVSVDVAGKPV